MSLTPLAGGASEPWCAHTVAILSYASSTIFAGTGIAAVGSPKALWAGQVAAHACRRQSGWSPPAEYNSTADLGPRQPRMLTHPASLTSALSMNRVTAIGVVTVTDTGTTFTKLSLLEEQKVGRVG